MFVGGVWGVGQSKEAPSHFVEPWILSESFNINFPQLQCKFCLLVFYAEWFITTH